MTTAADELTAHDVVRGARLDSLGVLLTRIANGLTLTSDEATLLVEHVGTEVSESTTARTAAAALSQRIEHARRLHQPIDGDGGPYCGTCTQDEAQPTPIGWWVPFPCPTVTALDEPARETP